MQTLAPIPPAATTAPTPPTRYSDQALLQSYRRDRDPRTRAELTERFLPLARHLARRYVGQAEREDLEQVAAFALVKAIERFDPDRGLAFTSFAVPTITGELKRYFRDLGWTVNVPRSVKDLKVQVDRHTRTLTSELGRAPTAAELAERTDSTVEQVLEVLAATTAYRPVSLDAPTGDDGDEHVIDRSGGQIDQGYARAEAAAVVDALVTRLPEREQLILDLRFKQDLTQAEIADRLGISQMHVSRLIRRSIEQLHRHARSES